MDGITGFLASRERQDPSFLRVPAANQLLPRLALDSLLIGHRGCVNTVQFNESGEKTFFIYCCCLHSTPHMHSCTGG